MKLSFEEILTEKTLVLLKPDATMRGLIGKIVQRFERTGLKIVACKMISPTREQLDGHFPKSTEWVRGMGDKTLEAYLEYNIDPVEIFGTSDACLIGEKIKEWNYHYLMLGPVMAIVLEGVHAVSVVRKLVGNTLPYKANAGTIRGDFSINAPDLANLVGSACKNLIHASGTCEEASQEIANWFDPIELIPWEKPDNFLHFVLGEFTAPHAEKGDQLMHYTLLRKKLLSLMETDPRNAGEHAYALAMLHKQAGNRPQAARFGREAINLFDRCQMKTMVECAAINTRCLRQ